MLPVGASVNIGNIASPLANSQVQNAAATRLSANTVAANAASSTAENNSKANNVSISGKQQQQVPAPDDGSEEGGSFSLGGNGFTTNTSKSGVQATFVAQLAGQDDDSPATQNVLVQYQKLVDFSNVKYKPSNAQKPLPEPSSVFGRILQAEKPVAAAPAQTPAPKVEQTQPQIQTPVAQPQAEASAVAQAVITPGVGNTEPTQTKSPHDDEAATTTSDSTPEPAPKVRDGAPQAASAYAATSQRIGSFNDNSLELV